MFEELSLEKTRQERKALIRESDKANLRKREMELLCLRC
jgi:hypothetical protein